MKLCQNNQSIADDKQCSGWRALRLKLLLREGIGNELQGFKEQLSEGILKVSVLIAENVKNLRRFSEPCLAWVAWLGTGFHLSKRSTGGVDPKRQKPFISPRSWHCCVHYVQQKWSSAREQLSVWTALNPKSRQDLLGCLGSSPRVLMRNRCHMEEFSCQRAVMPSLSSNSRQLQMTFKWIFILPSVIWFRLLSY